MTQLPPAYAPTRRAARPAPGQPIPVSIVPGHSDPKAQASVPHRQSVRPSAPVNPRLNPPPRVQPQVQQIPPVFTPAPVPAPAPQAPPSFAPAAITPAPTLAPKIAAAPAPAYLPASNEPEFTYRDDEQFEFEAEPRPRRKRHPFRIIALSLVALLIAVLAWPISVLRQANAEIQHVSALSGRHNTPGTTFLLAGTDARNPDDEFGVDDGITGGSRTDSILLLHQPRSGPTALISLPRDTFVQIPGVGPQKLNAAYAFGGPELLVQTVEDLTGLTIDHYVEISMGGLGSIVNVLGGVQLCLGYDVNDENSGLVWQQGCWIADGFTAIAFARMRYSDPLGDIGRADRQRQLINAIVTAATNPAMLRQVNWVRNAIIPTGLAALTFDDTSNIITLLRLGLAFRAATGPDGVKGTPPISDLDYRPGNIGSTVLLDPDLAPQFWQDLKNGDLAVPAHE